MKIIPLTLKEANEYIRLYHRHHKPVVGHRFSVGAKTEEIVGIAVVGRPVAREIPQYEVAEVTRLCTVGDKNVCSFLYAACARICKEMGFRKIQTYILSTEPGTSLKACGWRFECETEGGNWNHSWRKGRREDQPMCRKQRWGRVLSAEEDSSLKDGIPARPAELMKSPGVVMSTAGTVANGEYSFSPDSHVK